MGNNKTKDQQDNTESSLYSHLRGQSQTSSAMLRRHSPDPGWEFVEQIVPPSDGVDLINSLLPNEILTEIFQHFCYFIDLKAARLVSQFTFKI
jgi:hypothetical protein